ncbi:hypothetical protein [Cohnella silvisoli]|uniref:Copper amine oxidase-like N-terminal domain-containing protein n=1 Tax=Cohnella silvisoli TaxID=2873699 RepID=A0ABV1KZG0_9BACL|nr:hypothetical protein [Cohnella silvisoli]MCD9024747.1 hypothetical protein [Cohnella silvisoli]
MKQVGLLVVLMMVLFANTAAAHSSTSASEAKKKSAALSVLINGVPVQSKANHNRNGKVYVSVEAFATVLEQKVSYNSKHTQAVLNGKTIANLLSNKGEATAWVKDLADAIGAQMVTWDPQKMELYVLALPKGTIPLDPAVVPAMGAHWANPQAGDAPMGPIYGVYKGKLVFIEYMIAQEDFVQGKSHINLGGTKGMPMPRIEQTDIEFQPDGHPGFEVPHYDIHNYFVTDEEQQLIK